MLNLSCVNLLLKRGISGLVDHVVCAAVGGDSFAEVPLVSVQSCDVCQSDGDFGMIGRQDQYCISISNQSFYCSISSNVVGWERDDVRVFLRNSQRR
jgi:hypothetical protein